jgi:hypothetical protein
MVNTEELRELISGHNEWLLVRETGRTFPLLASEIDIRGDDRKPQFGFLDDKGLHTWRLNGFSKDGAELAIDTSGAFARKRELMRLVPRISAADLAAEVEVARLLKANEIARLMIESFPGFKPGRVSLNADNGRLAQIQFITANRKATAAISDITGAMTAESVLSAAFIWLRRLGLRKKNPINEIWIISEKRRSRNLQKLHALLSEGWKDKISIFEIDRKPDTPVLKELSKRKICDLWRERSAKLVLPPDRSPSDLARQLTAISPEDSDVIYSRQGETLRFKGLPFARVRTVAGKEKSWFGVGRDRRILSDDTWDEMTGLVKELKIHRSAEAPNRRHDYYRTGLESWLESILRRNIRLLDANLILAPLYNQFRSSNDKIDLLALRRDGRLIIIELKTQPDREMIFQAADYWRKIELQRRAGILSEANLFAGRRIIDKPALVYLAAPAWSFHRDFDFFARCISPEIELWRFELHENWRKCVKVLARRDYVDVSPAGSKR